MDGFLLRRNFFFFFYFFFFFFLVYCFIFFIVKRLIIRAKKPGNSSLGSNHHVQSDMISIFLGIVQNILFRGVSQSKHETVMNSNKRIDQPFKTVVIYN